MGRTVIIAGGGTGGHIYPAIAIARALREKDPTIQVHFVGTPAGLETKIIPKEGLPLHLMRIGKLNTAGGFLAKLRTVLGIPKALLQSAALLMELKPDAVLGVGGYASGPFVLTAALLGFRASIWEPNAKPGLTNRWLSRFVRRSYVVFDEAVHELKSRHIIPVGLPVRAEVERVGHKPENIASSEFRVLIFGGSQGARAINKVVQEALKKAPGWREGMHFVHQTGPQDFAEVSKGYEGVSDVEVREYLHDMDQRYQWADLIICRSGASTVAELAAARKPSILIPLPWAADDHQRKNAESLVSQKAATLIPQSELTADRLIEAIISMKKDTQGRTLMRENLERFHKPRAADRIAELILASGES